MNCELFRGLQKERDSHVCKVKIKAMVKIVFYSFLTLDSEGYHEI